VKEVEKMSNVAVEKVSGPAKEALPIFDEIKNRFEEVRKRAYDLFEKRGHEFGHSMEDWLKAEHDILGKSAAEMTEKDGSYELQVTLPGFEAKEVNVTATPAEIIVHAKSEHTTKTEEAKVLWTEFGSNEVYRRFEAPETIEAENVTARLEKGILRVHAPKMAVTKKKEVTVAAA
jgi:HSP20 family protein